MPFLFFFIIFFFYFLIYTHTHFESNTHTHWQWLRSACYCRQLAEGFPVQTAQTLRWQSCEGQGETHRGERIGRVGWPPANPRAGPEGGWSRKQGAWEMGEGQQVLPLSPWMADTGGPTHSHAYMRLDAQPRAKTYAWTHKYTLAGSYFTARRPNLTCSTTHWVCQRRAVALLTSELHPHTFSPLLTWWRAEDSI